LTLHIIVIGKTKDNHLRSLEKVFLQRLRRYTRVELTALREVKPPDRPGAREAESRDILRRLHGGDFVVVLDSRGEEMTSRGLSDFLERHHLAATKRMVFIIGGPEGLDPTVKDRADLVLSFSRFTLTHELIRVLLLEQLYRAWTLLRGGKYHH
jgi:23S rRNA (pseudouridine1915-N3)-methyltransferase